MPIGRMRYKAGRLVFLLLCLFLCTSCGQQKMSFSAAEKVPAKTEKTLELQKTEKVPATDFAEEEKISLLVNINTAGVQELMNLPGIGEVRAKAIIAYRQQIGEFEKIEDIMNVKGIKNGIFSKICDLICVK